MYIELRSCFSLWLPRQLTILGIWILCLWLSWWWANTDYWRTGTNTPEWLRRGSSWGVQLTLYPEPLASSIFQTGFQFQFSRPGDFFSRHHWAANGHQKFQAADMTIMSRIIEWQFVNGAGEHLMAKQNKLDWGITWLLGFNRGRFWGPSLLFLVEEKFHIFTLLLHRSNPRNDCHEETHRFNWFETTHHIDSFRKRHVYTEDKLGIVSIHKTTTTAFCRGIAFVKKTLPSLPFPWIEWGIEGHFVVDKRCPGTAWTVTPKDGSALYETGILELQKPQDRVLYKTHAQDALTKKRQET